VEGAPLVFSGDIGHDFVLHVQGKNAPGINLPARADAASGGFLIDTHAVEGAKLDAEMTGTLHGSWGFEAYEGPNFHLKTAHAARWTIPPAEQSALIVGREDSLHLQSDLAVCVDGVTVQDAQGRDVKTTWKLTKPDELEIKVALKDQTAGSLQMKLKQFGLSQPDELPLRAYSEAAHLEGFTINAGDQQGILKGTRLDEVDRFELNGIHFVPAKLTRANEKDELRLSAAETNPAALQPDERLVAHVALKDGRELDLPTTVEAPRPKMMLVSKNIQLGATPSGINLGSQEELPLDGQISFLVKTEIPEKLTRTERLEVATADEGFSVTLSVAEGTLILRDSENLLAVLDPRKAFGPSAFGPLRFRPVEADGAKGDWQPLATLVRVPVLKEIRCPESADKQCQLTGTNLFLLDSVASDSQFAHTAPVPTGFIDSTLSIPHPAETGLYVKLRDDPSTVSTVVLPVAQEEQPTDVVPPPS
jgi:hypothetical protein